MCVNNPRGPKT